MNDDKNVSVEVEVTIKLFDAEADEMCPVLSTTARLTKTDEDLFIGDKLEDSIYVHIMPGQDFNFFDATVSVTSNSKLTKAED